MTDRPAKMLGCFCTIALLVPLLVLGCAPGRVASRPPAAPGPARPAPTPDPSPTAGPSPSPTPAPIDFATQVRPLLEEKCTPCHFPGGRMYERLPFDREETVRTLGMVMFTRLRDPVDQELLRSFLAQPMDEPRPSPAP